MNDYIFSFGVIVIAACIYFTMSNTSDCYEVTLREDIRADTFLVNKCNGRVWKMAQYAGHKDEPVIWEEMIVYDPSAPQGSGMRMNYETFISAYPLKDKGNK